MVARSLHFHWDVSGDYYLIIDRLKLIVTPISRRSQYTENSLIMGSQ